MFSKIIIKNFKSNLHNYILFFISNILAVAELVAFWGINDIVTEAITDKLTATALKYDFNIAAGLITVITIFLMFFSMKHYVKLRIKDYSTFVTLGMRKRTSYLLMLTEYTIGGMCSLLVGAFLGIGLLYGVQYWIRNLYPEFVRITSFNWKVLRNACGLSIAIMAFVFVVLIIWMDGKNMSTLMSSSDRNEKRPVSNKWLILVFLGVGLLVVGEKLFQGSDMMYMWSHAVWPFGLILVVIFGMAWILECFRSKKRFYVHYIFQLNQLYSKFQNNLMILVLLILIHFFALTYLAVEISNILPIDKYRENYPYDNVWIARDDDREYAQKLVEKYDGTVEEVPMLRTVTRYGAQQIGVSASSYEELSGKACDIQGREIWIDIEDEDFVEEKELENWEEEENYEFLFVGNFDPEVNLIMLANTEEGKEYQYDLKRAFTQKIIGQYSLDQYHENIIVFSDDFFAKRWEEVRTDKTEASILYLFTFPTGKRKEATEKLKEYDEKYGIKNKESTMMESSLYNTEEYLIGQKMRAVFSLSSKIFLMASLLISGAFVVGLKILSEITSFQRRYDFLNYMGMKKKIQRKNIKFETKILSMISVGASFIMGLIYAVSYIYERKAVGDDVVGSEFWKYWAEIVTIYLVVVYLIQQIFGWYVIHRLEQERRSRQ